MKRKSTFYLALGYLTILLIIGVIYCLKHLFFLPNTNMFGTVPVGVPWFGALGAVLISLTGVFDHEHDWDESYWPWHVARPLVGAALGVVSVLIMQAGIFSVGGAPVAPTPTPTPPQVTTPTGGTTTTSGANPTAPNPNAGPTSAGNPTSTTPSGTNPAPSPNAGPSSAGNPTSTNAPTTPAGSTQPGSGGQNQSSNSKTVPNNLLYFLIAFLVGYREETFRELIKRLVDVLLSPGNAGAAPSPPTIQSVKQNPAPPDPATTEVTITGTGFTGAQSVKFGATKANIDSNTDVEIKATAPKMAPGSSQVTVTTKYGSAKPFPFTFS